jgi:biopolymer transport protein ExbD
LGLSTWIRVGIRLVIAGVLIAIPAYAEDKTTEPLTVTIEDGEVSFQGADLDIDQLTAQLMATGRQKERIYFRMGPHAKTAYTERVIAAIKAAGFSDIAVLPPPGLGRKDPEPPT